MLFFSVPNGGAFTSTYAFAFTGVTCASMTNSLRGDRQSQARIPAGFESLHRCDCGDSVWWR